MADRKKPKQNRSQQMVKDIVTATAAVVSESGVPGATIEKIAGKAGVSPGSIYQYFSTKQNVLGSFVTDELAGSREVILGLFNQFQDLPMPELNRAVINLMIDFFESRKATASQVYRHVTELGKADDHMRMRRETIAVLAEIFRRRRGELIVKDTDKAAAFIIHASMGALTAPFIDTEFPYTMSDLRQELIDMADRYLLGFSPAETVSGDPSKP